jgi:hypothetical protein
MLFSSYFRSVFVAAGLLFSASQVFATDGDGPTRAVAAPAPAAYTYTPSVPAAATAAANANTLAYIMAWRNAQDATEHTDALRLAATFAVKIGLSQGPAYTAIAQFLDNELAATPGRFTPADDPQDVIEQLLREDVKGFQRVISPLVSDDCYARYQSWLDALRIKAN